MPETIKRKLRYTSWPIVIAVFALLAMGVTTIRALEAGGAAMPARTLFKQVLFSCVGATVFWAATFVPYRRWGRLAYPMFALTIPLLVVVFFLPAINASHRWINLTLFKVQPSELAKLTYVIMLAWYLQYRSNYRRFGGLIVPFVLTFVPMALILFEPDLGTSMIFLPTLYVMLFVAGAKLKHLLGIVAVATVLVLLPVPHKPAPERARDISQLAYGKIGDYLIVPAPVAKMPSHQISRIRGWLRQEDASFTGDEVYQLRRAKMTLGAGGLTGRSSWNDDKDYYGAMKLPEEHTDFVFSVIGGQWGFMGGVFILSLYGIIFLFGLEIATATQDPFGRLLAVGVVALLFWQVVINVGMTMGVLPITGMTLPLVSYGGSSMVVNCFGLGLLVNVGQRRPISLAPMPFEYDD